MRLSAEAPAKINRELRVGRLRADGYHEVFSRMVSIDLADRLVAETADALSFSCDEPGVPAGEDNLVVRAARRLAERAGLAPRARLRLEKRTPAGGGLGGGSADAAVALSLLARLWGYEGGIGELAAVAADLGSDVPFFLWGGEAEVSGRGEIVRPVEDGPVTRLLLLVPPFAVPTAAVYRVYAGRGHLPERLETAAAPGGRYLGPNDLTPAVLQVEPRMEAYLASAALVSDDYAISGSGATIVVCASDPGARATLLRRHPEARLYECTTLTRDAYQRRIHPNGGSS
jgi:4-diphosphocytidyl-2-C-methyl-D-erythritol kinase